MTDALTRWCPPPDGTVPWDALDAELSWVRAMRDCPQDPIHHAEGNVWIHTRMVLEALVALPRWRALPTRERELVFAACLLHDIAGTTQVHDIATACARLRAPSPPGVLWELDVDPTRGRSAPARPHQLLFFSGGRHAGARPDGAAARAPRPPGLGQRGRWAWAVCDDQRIADNVALFEVLCEEGALDGAVRLRIAIRPVRFARRSSRSSSRRLSPLRGGRVGPAQARTRGSHAICRTGPWCPRCAPVGPVEPKARWPPRDASGCSTSAPRGRSSGTPPTCRASTAIGWSIRP